MFFLAEKLYVVGKNKKIQKKSPTLHHYFLLSTPLTQTIQKFRYVSISYSIIISPGDGFSSFHVWFWFYPSEIRLLGAAFLLPRINTRQNYFSTCISLSGITPTHVSSQRQDTAPPDPGDEEAPDLDYVVISSAKKTSVDVPPNLTGLC